MGKRAGKASPAKKPSGSEEQDVKRQRRAGCEATADELENDARAVSTAAALLFSHIIIHNIISSSS